VAITIIDSYLQHGYLFLPRLTAERYFLKESVMFPRKGRPLTYQFNLSERGYSRIITKEKEIGVALLFDKFNDLHD